MPRFLIHTKETRYRTYSVEAPNPRAAERQFGSPGDSWQLEHTRNDDESVECVVPAPPADPTRGALR